MIRAVRPLDVAALRAFLRSAGAVELTTHTWPKVQPESGHLPLAGVVGQALGREAGRRGFWLASSERRLSGFVVARARCDGLVWDVEHLHVGREAVAVDLLEHVCARAVDSGALRVFLDVPAGSTAVSLARRAGFERYAGSHLMRLSPPFRVDKGAAFAARPRLRADERALFQLYNAAVPLRSAPPKR